MIISNHSNRSRSHWRQACILLFAVLCLPYGAAIGQDYDAVGRRLRAAVQAGELSGEQARIMMETLKKSDVKDKKGIDSKAISKKSKTAVKADKLTVKKTKVKGTATKKEADC